MLGKNAEIESKLVGEGIWRKILAYNEQLMVTEFRFKQGAVVAEHAHPHAQTTYLVSGKFRVQLGDEVFDMLPGDAMLADPNVPHTVEVLEDSVAVDSFTPPREDFLK